MKRPHADYQNAYFCRMANNRHAIADRDMRITGSVSRELQENGEIMSDSQHDAAATAPTPHEPQIHHVQLVGDKHKNGVGVASLVVGIVASVLAAIPLVGMVAFFLGPVAILLGLIAVFLKNRRKGMAIAGLILGVVSLIVAGIMTAAVAAGVKAVDESINAEHTVEYVVTTTGPASISYWTGGGSSTEDVTAGWKKTITSKDINITSLTVTGDYSDKTAAVSCEILVDGKSTAKNTGSGAGAHASCSGSTWGK